MKPEKHSFIPEKKVGVLLVNLGTPDATNYISMWKYLREFLSDRRIIETPRVFWYPILYLIILILRPYKSGKLYKKIWDRKRNESPLRIYSKSLARKISKDFKKLGVSVEYAMNYGKPSIKREMDKLFKNGCIKILIVPLYPQYSATTTASVVDRVFFYLKNIRWQPTIRFCPPYFDDKLYIDALELSVNKQIKKMKKKPKRIVCSFHGIPKKYFLKGDPYHCHCSKTVRLLNERFKKENISFEISFQSRFGPQEWLRPYMNEKFKEILDNNENGICLMTPGFSMDCLETLEEIKIQGKKDFLEMGGKSFSYISCLNDEKSSVNMLTEIIKRELSGWIN